MSIQELTNRTKRRSFLSEKLGSVYDKISGNSLEFFGNMKGKVIIRKMMPADEDNAKNMIRNALLEFGGIGVDSLYFDEDLEYLLETYSKKGSRVIVAVKNGEIIGTAAIKPLRCRGGEVINGVGQLSQFYMRTEFRGQGIGNSLLNRIVEEAGVLGYSQCHATASTVFRNLGDRLLNAGFKLSDMKVKACGESAFVKHFIKNI